MGVHAAPHLDPVTLTGLSGHGSANEATDPLAAPFVEGARARDVADFCEASGIPAVMIDRTGHVLYATKAAGTYLGAKIRVESGHLTGVSDEIDRPLQDILSRTLGAAAGNKLRRRAAALPVDSEGESLTVTAIDYPSDSPYQLLKAVLVLHEGDEGKPAAARLMRHLKAH